jgi:hypothetical protein
VRIAWEIKLGLWKMRGYNVEEKKRMTELRSREVTTLLEMMWRMMRI